jgi:hypothetical protein
MRQRSGLSWATQLRVLRQLDHIAVDISIACATTPGFRSGFVNDLSTCPNRRRMSAIDIPNRQSDQFVPRLTDTN